MLTTGSGLRFAVLFVPLFALLAWPFASVGRGYSSLICGTANRLLSSSAPRVGRLAPNPQSGFEWHLTAMVWNQTTQSVEAQFDVDVHQTFYLPTALFTALTLAGKWTWGAKRVVPKLLMGVALFQLRGAVQFLELDRAGVDAAHARLSDVLVVLANRGLVAPLGMAIVLPLLVWFGLFRRSLVHRDA